MARVTVVVATYNRATVLSRTLRTLIAKSLQDWQAVVVGDACSDNTQDVIAALDDKRIQFVNLPERFGEQAGPNSVGMALASTPMSPS
ncbi:glycosyltransferase [Shimia thalassica]|uniref:glycosyltransferase family 2 protein n=1 Tax=Shimia thalassica TaxID=1715693 RepID=UPI0026E3DE51|nr:glycosyltransferase [Shimia thalassica]MDO6522053.1 glycosyltransferase [Shimia thalassica]